MAKQLKSHDSQAVDLLLDKAKHSATAERATFASPDEAIRHRVGPVEKVLNLLDLWHAEEPPADLVARTLARIGHSTSVMPGAEKRIEPFGPMA